MTPLINTYQQAVSEGLIKEDPLQLAALEQLNALQTQLALKSPSSWLTKFVKKKTSKTKGVYLWGSVGIGKTYLMDLFFDSIPHKRKLRLHLHHFMREVHQQLKALEGTANPLLKIAKTMKTQVDILCFDEFTVSDITDAMLLGNLFNALYDKGLTTVMTSNLPPQKLYQHGLQRSRFLPAIELIENENTVIHLASDHDYRQAVLKKMGVYFTPLDNETDEKLAACFQALTKSKHWKDKPIQVNERDITVIRRNSDVVWFDFNVICNIPRSQLDYLTIAEDFSTVIISNLPALSANQEDRVSYLIKLVDVFYDRKVRLILSAACPLEELVTTGNLQFEFQRTISRLHEMQSPTYWHQPRG